MSKAALAVGLPMGLGVEAAGAVRRMMTGSFGSLESFAVAFDFLVKGRSVSFDYNSAVRGTFVPKSAGKFLSSLYAGPSAFDLIAAQEINISQEGVNLGHVDAPMVILCQALIASRHMDGGLLVSWGLGSEKSAETVCWKGSLFLLKGKLEGLPVMTGSKMTVRVNLTKPPESSLVSGEKNESSEVWVTETVWEYFSGLADLLLVESTQASRLTGAGAGVIDAD